MKQFTCIKLINFLSCSSLLFFSWGVNAQKIFNTTGSTTPGDGYTLMYSVGEMPTQTLRSANGYITQGLLQPIFSLINNCKLYTKPIKRTVCLGESIEVRIESLQKFTEENEFTLLLSEEQDTFRNPRIIGKLKGQIVGNISATIPHDLDPNKKYILRVVSSNPKIEGCSTNLIVSTRPKANFEIDNIVCTGDTVLAAISGISSTSNSQYEWDFTDGERQGIPLKSLQGNIWNIAGQKNVKLIINNLGCKSEPFVQTVKVEQRLAKPKLKCAAITGNSITFTWSEVGGVSKYEVIRHDNYLNVRSEKNSVIFSDLAPQTKVFLEVQANGIGPCGVNRDTLTCQTLTCPLFSATLAQNVINSCAGETVQADIHLNGSNRPGEYHLIYSDGIKNDTMQLQPGSRPTFSPEKNTTYNFLILGNASFPGCYSPINNLNLKVNVTPNNFPGVAGEPKLVCDNETNPIVLNDQLTGEDADGQWLPLSNLIKEAFDSDAGTFTPKGIRSGLYEFIYSTVSKNGCPSRSEIIRIIVEPKLGVKIKDYSNCLELTGKTVIDLKTVARIAHPAAPNLVRWYRNETLTDTVLQEKIELSAPLTLFTVIGQGKCASPVSAITLKPGEELPVPKIEGDFEYIVGETINIRTSSSYPPGSIFTWRAPDTIVSGTDLYLFPARLTTKFSEGRYTLHVRGPQEPGKPTCESKTAWQNIVVFTQDEPALLIGKNVSDNLPWTIEGLEAFPNHKITVLNRWGEEVFTITGGYTNNWHGTFKDKKLPQGTYYYQIDTGETGKKPILGSLYVIR